LRAVEEVKRDMEAGVLMDRLICGDVGYGKTEVAMRAAFKAVMSGKQVALLAPTTVLAFQHYQTFKKRFEHFPVRVAMLSRLVDKRDAKLIIEDIYAGKIDIVIGTHRLLSKDVKFLDLGLLIIDEEQRFGVLHKEKLKSLYKDIDVLLLTATPIPRTLEMAFLGIRDMSVINTPPQDRLAVQTHVIKFNEEIIASAIEKELEREGQVFFIHNTIETIHLIEQLVRKLCPKARVISAHGKMQPKRIEDVMISFMNYEYDVLVCTTIIENGIDIPRANTIIINEADKFGLAQLYQLRGRVGRSSRRAYAYLVISERSFLSEMARKRLAALKEFSELGSGFRLAAADLQIRGAGNLLGKQQHGHIVELGFETYCNLLEEATKKMLNIPIKESIRPEIKIDLDFKIPEDYIPSDLIRMQFYKRIAKAESVQELNLIQDEMMDRFGKLPEAVENVLFIAKLGLIAKQKGLIKIMQKNNKIFLKWHLQIEEKMSNEIMINILKIAMNSSAQFLPDNSLMVPFSNYENVLNFVRQLPDFNMQ
jgi:transcription-repair coupling factor (superfamily II helicase)